MARSIVFGTLSAIAVTASAHAADMSTFGGGPFVPSAIWSGAYAGVNGGYASDAWERHGGIFDDGGFGGWQSGYNLQNPLGINHHLVLGIESDFEAAGIDHTGNDTLKWSDGTTTTGPHHREIDDFGTLRGRVGYSLERTLFYFTGGLAYGSVNNVFDVTRVAFPVNTTTIYKSQTIQSGYVLGAGVEYKLTPAWSLKAEYQFVDLANSDPTGGNGGYIRTGGTELNTVRAGINYRFNSPLDPLAAAGGVGGYKDSFAPAGRWAGLYTGVNGGYAWSSGDEFSESAAWLSCNMGTCTSTTNTAKSGLAQNGGFGGAQTGYNWQSERLVYGLESDIEAADVNGAATVQSASPVPFSSVTAHSSANLDWFGTIRGRLGYAVLDRGLLYATGGFAYGEVANKANAQTDFGQTSGKASEVATGYVVGGGVEYAFSPAWSAKAEFQYIDFGTKLSALAGTQASVESFDSFSTARAGLNYHLAPAYEPLK
ncbi:MAG: outer membrane protein [Rhodomicrobium sp.]